ncbi:heme-thiolate peroxidase [Auricularia subglabra TFB-10046 SS5]|nr:heme-thiolate peroxidase [Auricularia subglabra TFB-10046 SS5]
MPPSTPQSDSQGRIGQWQRPPHALSPCPALNALCNHNAYGLPRDGKNIHARQLVEALVGVYGLTRPFAVLLAYGAFFGVNAGVKRRLSFTLDLGDLCADRVAHAAPLVHMNPVENVGVAGRPSKYLTNKLIDTAPPDSADVDLDVFAQWRTFRERQPTRPVSYFASHIAAGELALLLQVFGDHTRNHAVDKKTLNDFLAHERLPAVMKPRSSPGVWSTVRTSTRITRAMAALNSTQRIPTWTYILVFTCAIAGILVVLFRSA